MLPNIGAKIIEGAFRVREQKLFGVTSLVLGAEVIETYPKDQPLLIVCNHIGPIENKGEFSSDSGLTPDVVFVNYVVRLLSNRVPKIIAGVNEEILSNVPALRVLPKYEKFMEMYYRFMENIYKKTNLIPVNKLVTVDRKNTNFLAEVKSAAEANNIIVHFGEGLWRAENHDYSVERPAIESSAFWISRKLDVPVLPAFIYIPSDFAHLRYPKISFGQVINAENYNRQTFVEEIGNQWINLQKDLRAQ